MSLEEFYASVGGDYADVIQRLCIEEIVVEFLLRFAEEPIMERLQKAIDARDQEEAFIISHTLKGTCINMGLGTLYSSASRLTEALRGEFRPEAPELFEALKRDHQDAVRGIRALQGK